MKANLFEAFGIMLLVSAVTMTATLVHHETKKLITWTEKNLNI